MHLLLNGILKKYQGYSTKSDFMTDSKIPGDFESSLFVIDEKKYGKEYKKHMLEQYKLYVDMADKIQSRRSTANNFFLTVNTLLITAVGILTRLGSSFVSFNLYWVAITSFAGILFCWTWLVTIKCYRNLSDAKFRIINAIERKLPVAAFDIEWACLTQQDKDSKYPELTKVEKWVPIIFGFLYFVLIVIGVLLVVIP